MNSMGMQPLFYKCRAPWTCDGVAAWPALAHPVARRPASSGSNARLVSRLGERVLNDLVILARELHRPKLVSELRYLAVKAERQLVVVVVYRRAGIDTDVE